MEITAIDLPPAYTPVPTHQPTRHLTASDRPPSYSALPTQQPARVTGNSPPPTYSAAVQQVSEPRTLRASDRPPSHSALPTQQPARVTGNSPPPTYSAAVQQVSEPRTLRETNIPPGRAQSRLNIGESTSGSGAQNHQPGRTALNTNNRGPIRDQPRSHHTVRTNQQGNGNLPRRQNGTGISTSSSNQTGIAARRSHTPFGYKFAYSMYPVKIQCQFCQKEVTTKVKGSMEYYCCWFPLCLLALISWPLYILLLCICCMCNKYHHTCPECRKKVGVSG